MSIAFPPWYIWFDGVAGAAVVALSGFLYKRFRNKLINPSSNRATYSISDSRGNTIVSSPITDSHIAVGENISQSVEIHHHYGAAGRSQMLNPTFPTPADIVETLANAKPFDFEHAKGKYRNLDVLWKVKLYSITSDGSGWEVCCTSGEGGSGIACVVFVVSTVSPELKLADKGTLIWIKGRIESVWNSGMRLERNPEIILVETSPNS